MPSTSLPRRALAAGRLAFTPLALLFLALAFYAAGDTMLALLRRTSLPLLAAACGLWLITHLVVPVFTWRALRALDAPLSYRQVLSIHVARLPARYLPGGIWHTVSRMTDLSAQGASRGRLAKLVTLEHLVPFGMALLLGGALLGFSRAWTALSWLAGGAGGLLIATTPWVLSFRAGSGRNPPDWRGATALAAAGAVLWCLAASAFCVYWSAFPAPSSLPALQVAGAYLLAWAAGFAVLFAPQGLGVFEVTIAFLLQGSLPIAGAALVAAGFRAVQMVADMLAFLLWAAVRARRIRAASRH